MKNLLLLQQIAETEACGPDKDPDENSDKLTFKVEERKTSWWDKYRGATIFYIGLFVVIVFGVIPWILGWARIVKTLIRIF